MYDRPSPSSSFFASLYTWLVSLFCGMVVMDTLYARLAPDAQVASPAISDFLLVLGIVTLVAALVAIATAWTCPPARGYLIASLAVVLFEFLIPMVFGLLALQAPAAGLMALLRIAITALASILAFIGLYHCTWNSD